MASNRTLMRNGGIIGNCTNSKISAIKQNKCYQKGCLSALSNILEEKNPKQLLALYDTLWPLLHEGIFL